MLFLYYSIAYEFLLLQITYIFVYIYKVSKKLNIKFHTSSQVRGHCAVLPYPWLVVFAKCGSEWSQTGNI